MKMKLPSTRYALSALSMAVMAATATTQVQAEDAFYEALTSGKATMDVRLRYEGVDVDTAAPADSASGLTVRTRLGYKTGELAKTSAFVEMEDVRIVGGVGDFTPNEPGYAVIADPKSTELNQAYLSFKPVDGLNIIGGRQRLILDNARFVGNVGWRQNEQTFDALTVKYAAGSFDSTVSYLGQINGIVPKFDADVEDIIVNMGYKIDGIGKVSAYYYGLDHSETRNEVQFDNDTYGVRFTGKAGNIVYTAEFAQQETASDKSASYMLGELGYAGDSFTLLAGYEVLGSDSGTYGFQTPLATKHAFNGWADKFLLTPTDGLEDAYIKGVFKAAGMKFVAVAHNFTGSESGDDLGSEIDLLVVKPFAKKYKVGLKYAGYSEGDLAMNDTTKYWLWGEMKF